jgi:hypothetical protein
MMSTTPLDNFLYKILQTNFLIFPLTLSTMSTKIAKSYINYLIKSRKGNYAK